MYQYTCPNCDTASEAEDVLPKTVIICPQCSQQMRLSVSESSDPSAGARQRPPNRILGPLLAGGCGLVGLLIGGLILLLATSGRGGKPVRAGQNQEPTDFVAELEKFERSKPAWGKGAGKGGPPGIAGPGGAPADVDKLIMGLAAPGAEARKTAVLALGTQGFAAKKAVPDLLRIVRNATEVAIVRRAAVDALDRIKKPDLEHTKLLLDALADATCFDARRYAAKSLESSPESMRKDVLKALAKACKDEDAKVRQYAVVSLGAYDKDAYAEAYQDLVGCLRDGEKEVRTAAHDVLKRIGVPEDDVDVAAVKDLLEGEKEGVKPTAEARYWGVLLLVRKLKEKGLPLLVDAVEKPENFKDPIFVGFVVTQLREFKLNSAEVGHILAKTLDHANEEVQAETLHALDSLDLGEHTIEAYIKVFARGQKLIDKVAMATRKPVPDFGRRFKPLLTTFNKEIGLKFKITPAVGEALLKAVEDPADFPRLFAVYSLGTIGKATPKAVAALASALVKEKSTTIRIEILAALAAHGETATSEFNDSKEAQTELDRLIDIARDDTRATQIMASLTKAALYPGQAKTDKAYRILARALLLKNATVKPEVVQRWWGAAGPGRMPPRGVPGPGAARPEAVSQDKELHQRAREALGLGGVTAGEAIYVIFKSTFVQLPGEKLETMLDKLQARLVAYQVLGKIGTVLKNHEMTENGKKFNPVRRLLTETGDKINKRFEDTSVFDAAKEARLEIFGK